jgi:AcrR family transcriptional regulator
VADQDLTAKARIRDAAIARFATQGIAATSVKSIADDAGVSPPLVLHHFGSKDGLRAACDHYIATQIREAKLEAAEQGAGFDPLEAMRRWDRPYLMRYLARTLADGSEHVATLIDEMVADAEGYVEVAVASGFMKPSDYPRERVVILMIWMLGGLVLHEHLERLLGVDLTDDDPDNLLGYLVPAMELLGQGALADRFYEQTKDALRERFAERQVAQGAR